MIIEDSHIGKRVLRYQKAEYCGVKDTKDVTYNKIKKYINDMNDEVKPKKMEGKMNVLIPIAVGSRFEQAGYSFPKPLIEDR